MDVYAYVEACVFTVFSVLRFSVVAFYSEKTFQEQVLVEAKDLS